jgi:WD40 repeat protein
MFGGPISFSTPHLYVSALPFAPKDSQILKKFGGRLSQVLKHVSEHNLFWPVIQHVLHGHSDGVNSAAFSPDGKHIISGSDDKTI